MFAWLRRWFRRDAPPVVQPRGRDRFDPGEPEICDCPCHGNRAIMHVMACCTPCERCHVRFRAGLAKHLERCR